MGWEEDCDHYRTGRWRSGSGGKHKCEFSVTIKPEKVKKMKTLELQLGVTKIVVLRGFGTDKVILHTNRPSPYPPDVSSDPLTVQFETRHGYAEEYVKSTFGVEVDEVINTNTLRARYAQTSTGSQGQGYQPKGPPLDPSKVVPPLGGTGIKGSKKR